MKNDNKEMVYLAVAYSHPNKQIRKKRFEIVNEIAATLMREGLHIYSPISHTHPIALAGDLPTHWDFWKLYDETFLKCCKKLIVLKLDGWRESKGVTGEIQIATELDIPIEYIEYCGEGKYIKSNEI